MDNGKILAASGEYSVLLKEGHRLDKTEREAIAGRAMYELEQAVKIGQISQVSADYIIQKLITMIDNLNDVLTATEAAEAWNLDTSTIRRACLDGRFKPEEARRTGKNWLVTRAGMERIYGPAQAIGQKGE